MPVGDTVCAEPVIGAVIAEIVKETARIRFIPAAFGFAWMYRRVFSARLLSWFGKPVLEYRCSQKCPVRFNNRLKHMAVYQLM